MRTRRERRLSGVGHDLQYHDSAFMRAVAQPALAEALVAVVGPNVHLHHTKMLVKPPGEGRVLPDAPGLPVLPAHAAHRHRRERPLRRRDRGNDCLFVVPGSHLLGPIAETRERNSLPDYALERGVPVPAEAGDWGQGLMVAGENPFWFERRH